MVSKYFEVLPYRLNDKTGYIDMDEVELSLLLSCLLTRLSDRFKMKKTVSI